MNYNKEAKSLSFRRGSVVSQAFISVAYWGFKAPSPVEGSRLRAFAASGGGGSKQLKGSIRVPLKGP